MSNQVRSWRYHVLTLLWAFAVAVLTLSPAVSQPEVPFLNIPYFDKIAHTGIFAVLSFLMARGIVKQQNAVTNFKNAFFITLPITVSYGGLIEYLQNFVPGRSVELFDLIANIAGVLLGLTSCYFLLKLKSNRS